MSDDGVQSVDAIRREAYRWAKEELPDLVDDRGHPCMWAVAAAVQIIRRGDEISVLAVRALRNRLMPAECRAAWDELAADPPRG